jgi:hypothetical protein
MDGGGRRAAWEHLGMTDRERQVKRLVLTAVDECAVCGHEYELDNVDVIGNRGDMWVLRVNCPGCQKQGFIAALVNGQEPAAVAAPVEPPIEVDPRHDGQWSPITAHDVLEMHEFLAGFEGDFVTYLMRDE